MFALGIRSKALFVFRCVRGVQWILHITIWFVTVKIIVKSRISQYRVILSLEVNPSQWKISLLSRIIIASEIVKSRINWTDKNYRASISGEFTPAYCISNIVINDKHEQNVRRAVRSWHGAVAETVQGMSKIVVSEYC